MLPKYRMVCYHFLTILKIVGRVRLTPPPIFWADLISVGIEVVIERSTAVRVLRFSFKLEIYVLKQSTFVGIRTYSGKNVDWRGKNVLFHF